MPSPEKGQDARAGRIGDVRFIDDLQPELGEPAGVCDLEVFFEDVPDTASLGTRLPLHFDPAQGKGGEQRGGQDQQSAQVQQAHIDGAAIDGRPHRAHTQDEENKYASGRHWTLPCTISAEDW